MFSGGNGNGYIDSARSDVLNPIGADVLKRLQNPTYWRTDLFTRDQIKRDSNQFMAKWTWKNLPGNITGQDIERIIYYRGKGAFTYIADRFWFLPFHLKATDGSGIDAIGRFTGISLTTFNGSAVTNGKGTVEKGDDSFLGDLSFTPVYELFQETDEFPAVPLWDISIGQTQEVVPLGVSQLIYCQALGEQYNRIMRNDEGKLKNFVLGISDEAEYAEVKEALKSMQMQQRFGDQNVTVIKSRSPISEFKGTESAKSQDFWESAKSMDSIRMQNIGVDAGSEHNKKERKLVAEQKMDDKKGDLIKRNNFFQRKRFCQLVNNTFGLAIDVEDNQCDDEGQSMYEEGNNYQDGGGDDGSNGEI